MLRTKCNTSDAGKTCMIPPVRVPRALYEDIEDHLRRIGDTNRGHFVRRAIRETIARDRRHQADRAARIVGARAKAEGLFVEVGG